MKRRTLPGTNIALSQICFGSMRFLEEKITESEGIELLSAMVDMGISTLHSSHEYESYPFFCEVLTKYKKLNPSKKLEHIVKLPAPHFKEDRFCKNKFIELVDSKLLELGAERLEVVQWLLRHEPNTDEFRIPLLYDCCDELAEVWAELKQAGKVGVLYSFPYSSSFANEVLKVSLCSGITDYLNLIELENTSLMPTLLNNNQGFIAIRPYCAGRINELPESKQKLLLAMLKVEALNDAAIQFPLLNPLVVSEVVSFSSSAHLTNIVENTASLVGNESLFNDVLGVLTK